MRSQTRPDSSTRLKMIRSLLLPLVLAHLSASVLADKPLPVEAFANLPSVTQVRLSPNGENVASLVKIDREDAQGTLLQVFNLPKREVTNVAFARTGDRFINWIRWASDERLLVSSRFPALRRGTPTTETRLQSIDVETREVRDVLLPSFVGKQRYRPQYQDRIVDILPNDKDHILLASKFEKSSSSGVIQVNLKTGRTKRVMRDKVNVVEWVTDRQHRVRIALWHDETTYKVLHKEADGPRWYTLWEFEAFSESQVWPMSFDKDPDYLYVSAYHEGRLAVFKVHLSDPELQKELVFSDPDYDAQGSLIYSRLTGEIVGIKYSSDGGFTFWANEYQLLQDSVDTALPKTTNFLYSLSDNERQYVALATSDTNPGTYYIADRDEHQLRAFAHRYPSLPIEQMSEVQTISYEARDGLAIEGFLTVPKTQGTSPYPAIIFPHGGPISLDEGGFNYWTQYFASRGYAVLQMNFRGSSGYGYDFMKSGLQAWGLEMQNDVEDGTRWLIEEGIADPERICVVGASYGGYAALMEAARNSELYKCAVSFAGVTDVAYLVSSSRHYTNFEIVKEQIGSDYSELRQRSPLHIAEEINIPVLLAHGTEDRSVRIRHSEKMHRELEKQGKDVTYLELEDGDHHLSNQEHRVQFFKAMDAFLRLHL
jgi:dipeptidyl aminopeptidase/acylaminoacyl peptidase